MNHDQLACCYPVLQEKCGCSLLGRWFPSVGLCGASSVLDAPGTVVIKGPLVMVIYCLLSERGYSDSKGWIGISFCLCMFSFMTTTSEGNITVCSACGGRWWPSAAISWKWRLPRTGEWKLRRDLLQQKCGLLAFQSCFLNLSVALVTAEIGFLLWQSETKPFSMLWAELRRVVGCWSSDKAEGLGPWGHQRLWAGDDCGDVWACEHRHRNAWTPGKRLIEVVHAAYKVVPFMKL